MTTEDSEAASGDFVTRFPSASGRLQVAQSASQSLRRRLEFSVLPSSKQRMLKRQAFSNAILLMKLSKVLVPRPPS